MFDDTSSVCYYLITYAIKAIVFFVFLMFWSCSNFWSCVVVFFVVFVALDFVLVRFLPYCPYKENILRAGNVPSNMYFILAIDYITKAIVFYYVYIYYYLSLTNWQQILAIYLVMAGIDIIYSYILLGIGPNYANNFICTCSM